MGKFALHDHVLAQNRLSIGSIGMRSIISNITICFKSVKTDT